MGVVWLFKMSPPLQQARAWGERGARCHGPGEESCDSERVPSGCSDTGLVAGAGWEPTQAGGAVGALGFCTMSEGPQLSFGFSFPIPDNAALNSRLSFPWAPVLLLPAPEPLGKGALGCPEHLGDSRFPAAS